ncbi:auxin-responsive protein SAUR68-like [Jatropha curcas]|uniref:auxin-responsive protein SAUR68-like n=1 Tax=Jatropha curcas TaxID=180498 RepID=UPI0005FBFBF5|nr:auxin-responsive protein SAUR68-like [Jatropha curcas]
MISPKKLLKLARKWQKMAALRRKRIILPQTIGSTDKSSCSTSAKAEIGHFAVYSADQERFLLPLEYLNNEILRELFKMAEEEFGLMTMKRLTLPCDAELMEYAITLIKQNVSRDIERAFLMSIVSSCYSSPFHLQHQETVHQLPICSF